MPFMSGQDLRQGQAVTWLVVSVSLWWLGFMACHQRPEIAEIRRKYGWGYRQLGAQMVLAWSSYQGGAR